MKAFLKFHTRQEKKTPSLSHVLIHILLAARRSFTWSSEDERNFDRQKRPALTPKRKGLQPWQRLKRTVVTKKQVETTTKPNETIPRESHPRHTSTEMVWKNCKRDLNKFNF